MMPASPGDRLTRAEAADPRPAAFAGAGDRRASATGAAADGAPAGDSPAARRRIRARRTRVIGVAFIALALGVSELVGGDGTSELGSPDPGPASATAGAGSRLPAPLPLSRGTTRYVSPTGSDAAPGTGDRPWRTVQKALNALAPGERALVRAGTYTADHVMRRAGTATAPITVAAYRGERPVLRAASRSGDTYPLRFTDGAANVRVKGFAIERATGISSTNVYFEGNVHHVELSRNDIRYSQDQGVFAERSTRALQILANRIHDNGLNHRQGQHQSHGLYIEGRDHLIANNVVYDHPNGFGIQLYPANRGTKVVHNTVVGSGHSGLVLGGDEGVSDIVVRNNIFAFNARYGVQMDSDCPTRTVIDRNVIRGNRGGSVQAGCRGVDTSRGNILSNPFFVSPARADYRLRLGSPAIDRAMRSHSPRTDALGRRRPRGSGYDIGAYERAP